MEFPQELKQGLRDHKVIPFIGAGVSMAVRRRGSLEPLFPSWKQLLLSAADRLEKELKKADADLVKAIKVYPIVQTKN